jgi:hypothetical protein
VSRGLFDELRIEQAVCRSQRMASSPAKGRVRKFCPHPEEAARRIRQQPSSTGGHPLGWPLGSLVPVAIFRDRRAGVHSSGSHAADDRGPSTSPAAKPASCFRRSTAAGWIPPRLRSRCRMSSFDRAGVTGCPAFIGDDTATGMNVRVTRQRPTRPFPSHHLTKPTIHEIIWRERT